MRYVIEALERIACVMLFVAGVVMLALSVLMLTLGVLSFMVGCALTSGDPYEHPIECYDGPTLIEALRSAPTPTPTPTPISDAV